MVNGLGTKESKSSSEVNRCRIGQLLPPRPGHLCGDPLQGRVDTPRPFFFGQFARRPLSEVPLVSFAAMQKSSRHFAVADEPPNYGTSMPRAGVVHHINS